MGGERVWTIFKQTFLHLEVTLFLQSTAGLRKLQFFRQVCFQAQNKDLSLLFWPTSLTDRGICPSVPQRQLQYYQITWCSSGKYRGPHALILFPKTMHRYINSQPLAPGMQDPTGFFSVRIPPPCTLIYDLCGGRKLSVCTKHHHSWPSPAVFKRAVFNEAMWRKAGMCFPDYRWHRDDFCGSSSKEYMVHTPPRGQSPNSSFHHCSAGTGVLFFLSFESPDQRDSIFASFISHIQCFGIGTRCLIFHTLNVYLELL